MDERSLRCVHSLQLSFIGVRLGLTVNTTPVNTLPGRSSEHARSPFDACQSPPHPDICGISQPTLTTVPRSEVLVILDREENLIALGIEQLG